MPKRNHLEVSDETKRLLVDTKVKHYQQTGEMLTNDGIINLMAKQFNERV